MQVVEIIQKLMPVNDEELNRLIESIARFDLWHPGEIINTSAEEETSIRFLIKGIARGYYNDENGKEVTVWYANKPGDVIVDFKMLGVPASEITLAAITECETLRIPVNSLIEFQSDYPEVGLLYLQYLSQFLHYQWNMEKMLYMKLAKDRYEWFQQEYPGLIDEVNNAQIASFLNITPVTLSRIRNET